MAKPKSPLLSLGARGSIGDTLTFQKRGRLTIARQKPIPTDPKTDLQLAQRQVYREAVAAWNALTPEEQEAYRGLCPGLTPYQCYMKTALAAAPPGPPPEEQTEEQTENDTVTAMFAGYRHRAGQRLTIPNRQVTKLAFILNKGGSPSGDLTLEIRKVSDDEVIVSKVWGPAVNLGLVGDWQEVTFDSPATINQEVRPCVRYEGGNSSNYVQIAYQNSDVKPDEMLTLYLAPPWSDSPTLDCAYRYKYYEV
ncbi:hypothetical protein ES705_25007 [subsurface metagenome]